MRNEIYSRIRQNKMKYYAELKNLNEPKNPVTLTVEKKPETKIPIRETQPREKNAFLQKVQEYNYKSMFQKVPEAVKNGYRETLKSKALSSLKAQVKNDHKKIRQFGVKVNQKIDRQTDKLANGVYNMSSFLFEDQDESNNNSAFVNGSLVVETIGNNTIEWNVAVESQPSVSVYDKIGELSDKTFAWIRTVPGNKFLVSGYRFQV
jgi:hypothetical protein